MKVLITGGCGFIGSHFVRYVRGTHPDYLIVNLDALTYAGKLENLEGMDTKNYEFVKGNIGDQSLVTTLFEKHDFDAVINFAAETHVDNSIKGPRIFIETNIEGTLNLMECAYQHWKDKPDWKKNKRYFQISTDEVYGTLPENEPNVKFTETTPLDPRSPYSSSKASADLIVMAYFHTFGMPAIISRCSNNYGPNQDEEKLIPLMITHALQDKKLPVYGDGCYVRDWLHVHDHCKAVDLIWHEGTVGETYNIGGNNEWKNIDIVERVLKQLKKPESLIEHVTDRPGHDRRYAMDTTKLKKELSWSPEYKFEQGLQETVEWYTSKAAVH